MKRHYLVGGPKLDQFEQFVRSPDATGNMPTSYSVYLRSPNDGKDNSKFEPQAGIWKYLLHLDENSQWSQILVVTEQLQ